MNRTHPDFFYAIPNSAISDYHLERLSEFRDRLIDVLPGSDSKKIVDLFNVAYREGYDEIVDDISSEYELYYMLILGLANDAAKGHQSFFINLLLNEFRTEITSDANWSGMSLIWRSLGITNEADKIKFIPALIDEIKRITELSPNTYRDMEETPRSLTELGNETHPECDEDLRSLLLRKDFFNYASFKSKKEIWFRFTSMSDKSYRPEMLFRWIMPLCHRAYMTGFPADSIIESVEPMIEGLALAYGITSKGHMDIFKRRCLSHISFGFPRLMKAIDIQKDDLLPMRGWSSTDLHFIMFSPIQFQSEGDYLSAARHDLDLVAEFGIKFDIDDVMLMEEVKPINECLSLLGKTQLLGEDYIMEAIEHPAWKTLKEIRLGCCYLNKKNDNEALELAIFRRTAIGLSTEPSLEGPWSRSDQKRIIGTLMEEGLMTDRIVEIMKPDADILASHFKSLPKQSKRHVLQDDLGL